MTDLIPASPLVDLVAITRVERSGRIRQRFTNLIDLFREYGNARPIKAVVAESSRLMSHPIENGEVITDHRVVLPISISIAVILNPFFYRQTYNLIRNDYNSSQRFSIRTKTHTYNNMYLREIPHEEDASKFDTVTMVLEFIEAQFFNVQEAELEIVEVQESDDASTTERGDQANREITAGADLLDRINSFFGSGS